MSNFGDRAEPSRLIQFTYSAPMNLVPVIVGSRAWRMLPDTIVHLTPSRVFVVSHRSLRHRYGAEINAYVGDAGFRATWLELPEGEAAKTVRSALSLWRLLASAGTDRDAVILLLGGGIVGDVGGFVAGSYLRGIRVISLPTTALAQADSCVGGKTGVNLTQGKNLVGAFWHPSAILCDTRALADLPVSEWRQGLAEVVRCAAVMDAALFSDLERLASVLSAGPGPYGAAVLANALRIKARVVERDERDQSERLLLNFGHSFAHAYEALARFRGLSHGYAVASGMIAASLLGERLGISESDVTLRLRAVLRALSLPFEPLKVAPARLLAAMGSDKKRRGRMHRLVVAPRIGSGLVVSVSARRLERLLASLL